MRPRNLLIFIVVVVILGLGLRAYRRAQPRPVGEAYVAVTSAPLWSRVAEVREVVVRVRNGERLGILERRRGWAYARTADEHEGWIEERFLVSREVFDQFERLEREASAQKPQATGMTRVLSNLHSQPGRATPRLYQLQKNEAIEVLARAVVERAEENAAAEPGAESPTPAEVRREDWLLVRRRAAPHRIGWLLARFVALDVPEEITALAGEKRIVSAIDLGRLHAEDEKPAYFAALMDRAEGLPYDFDAVRVFTWSQKRGRYETAFVESNLAGYWPIESHESDGDRIFSFSVDEHGARRVREYRMHGVVVRRLRASAQVAGAR